MTTSAAAEVDERPPVGASAPASHASPSVTMHGNVAASLTRSGRPGVFGSFIIEGPLRWPVRPVAEAVVEQEFDGERLVAGLAGLIWRIRDDLSWDVAYRGGRVGGDPVHQVRAGFTWGWKT